MAFRWLLVLFSLRPDFPWRIAHSFVIRWADD